MTDRQRAALLRSALADFKKTTEGYRKHPKGVNWRRGLAKTDQLLQDLIPPPIPQLGPVIENGLAMLLFAPTHITSGVGYPAFDTAFGQAGRWVVAPEVLTVTRQSSAQGGDAFYATGVSTMEYWVGHIDRSPATGTKFRKGQRIARVANISAAHGGPHSHWGIDARPLIGKHLLWGANGNGPPYTYGAPTIGAQLAKGLA